MTEYSAYRSDNLVKQYIDYGGLRRHFPLPTSFVLTLTHKCNLACDMCTQYGGMYKNNQIVDLPACEWERFIQRIAWIKPRITLFGGEPLIYPEIKEIFEVLYKYQCSAEVVTNGYFLEEFLEDIVRCNIEIVISIDGVGETHNAIRHSKKSFERIVGALEQIKRLRAKNISVRWSANFVLLPENLDTVPEFLAFIHEYQPDRVSLQHLQFSSIQLNEQTNNVWMHSLGVNFKEQLQPKKQYDLDEVYVDRLTYTLAKAREDFGSRLNLSFFPDLSDNDLYLYYSEDRHFQLQRERICTKPWLSPTIQPNGDVLLCLDHPVGNITSDDFWKIWGGEQTNRFRRTLTMLEHFPICTRCCLFYQHYDREVIEEVALA